MNGELHCLQRWFTDRCSASDVGARGVVLNVAQCVCDTHLQGAVLNISQCVWYTPTGCCVENRSVCVIHTYRVLCWTLLIIIIIIIGTTSPFEPWPSSEAIAGCPCSLQHSSNFSPPTSWHLPSHHLPILVSACPLSSSFYHCNENSSCRAQFRHTNNMSCPF